MTSESDHSGLVVDEIYHKAHTDLSQLHAQLPRDAVAALAREVLKRLANQDVGPASDSKSIVDLSEALMATDPKAAAVIIERHYRDGITSTSIYLDYLAPAAALLGKWWETDEITFADVTIGTGRVYAIMRSLNSRTRLNGPPKTKSAVFAVVPEDDHVLGLKMAIDLARKEGWEIEAHLSSDHDTLVEEITSSGQLLIGLSAGGIHALPNLARLILALRISAPNAKILVSGGIVDAASEKIELLHVDAIARSFEEAMSHLDRFWESFHTDTA